MPCFSVTKFVKLLMGVWNFLWTIGISDIEIPDHILLRYQYCNIAYQTSKWWKLLKHWIYNSKHKNRTIGYRKLKDIVGCPSGHVVFKALVMHSKGWPIRFSQHTTHREVTLRFLLRRILEFASIKRNSCRHQYLKFGIGMWKRKLYAPQHVYRYCTIPRNVHI